MLYVQSRKSFKVRREKKLIYLPSAKKHSAKLFLCRVLKKNSQQTYFFAECHKRRLSKHLMVGTLTDECPCGGFLSNVSVLPSVFS